MSTDVKIGISAGVLFVGLLGGLAFYKFQQSGHTLEDLGVVAAGAVEAMFAGSAAPDVLPLAGAVPTVSVTQVAAAVESAPVPDAAGARILKASDAPPAGAPGTPRAASPPATPAPATRPDAKQPTVPEVKRAAVPKAERATRPAPDGAGASQPPAELKGKPTNVPAWTPALPLAAEAGKEPPTTRPAGIAESVPAAPLVMPPPPEAKPIGESAAPKAKPNASEPRQGSARPPADSSGNEPPSAPAILVEGLTGQPAGAAVIPPKPAATSAVPRPAAPAASQTPQRPVPAPRRPDATAGASGLAASARAVEPPNRDGAPVPAEGAIGKVEEMLRLLRGSPGPAGNAPLQQAQHAEPTPEQGGPNQTIVKEAAPTKSARPGRAPEVPAAKSLPPARITTAGSSAPAGTAARTKTEGSMPAQNSAPPLTGAPTVGGAAGARPAGDRAPEVASATPRERGPTVTSADNGQNTKPLGARSTSSEGRTPIPSPRSFAASTAELAGATAPTDQRRTGLPHVPGTSDSKGERKVIAKATPDPPPRTSAAEPPAAPRKVVPPADVREELVAVGPTASRVEKFQLVSRQELTDRDPAEQVKVASYDVESYIVLAGDSFESIAVAMYGRREYGPALSHYNRAAVPPGEALKPGGRVKIPPAAILEQAAPKLKAAAPRAASPGVSAKTTVAERPGSTRPSAPAGPNYTVRQQETLFAIAKKTLGDGTRWEEIYRLNTDRLENEYAVPIGVVLRLPAGAKVEPAPAAP